MSSVIGNNLKISLFGDPDGFCVGVVIDGLETGIDIDMNAVSLELVRRRGLNPLTIPEEEKDVPAVLSGIKNNKTCRTPLCAVIEGGERRSGGIAGIFGEGPRDLGDGDLRIGAVAGIVFAGAVCKQALKTKGIFVGSHILSAGAVKDEAFDRQNISPDILQCLASEKLPLLDPYVRTEIEKEVREAEKQGDSLGGIVEGAIIGVPAGLGRPVFDGVESVLGRLLFSLPSVKGVDFGAGFALAEMKGSCADDGRSRENGEPASNWWGGTDKGVSNGMNIICRAAFKPSSCKNGKQDTRETFYDPCVALKACPVVEAMLSVGILDMLYCKP